MPTETTTTDVARRVSISGVHKAFGDTEVLRGIELEVEPGRSLALLGPSGCGKTTLLRLIAGLETPDGGEINVGGTVMAGPNQWVPPERRNIGMVFQDWALFPHLTVGKNVEYGLDREERKNGRASESLEMVGLEHLAHRMPDTLSGGQQQRVALARAIAPRPTVLLLDEPFSNLDSALRVGVRTEVHRLLIELGITSVFVTHDQEEAFVLGDEVAVMRSGVIEQLGTPHHIYEHPQSPWIASFVGEANLLDGDGAGDKATSPIGDVALKEASHGAVSVLIRPEDLRVEPGGDHVVSLVEYYGHDTMVTVTLDAGTELQARVPARTEFSRGDRVTVSYAGEPTVAFSR